MKTTWRFFYILFAGLVTGFLHYTFAPRLPVWSIWPIKLGLPLLFGSVWFLSRSREHQIFAKINLPFFILNLGLLVAFLLATPIENLFNLDQNTAGGLALVKLIECCIVSLTVIFGTLVVGLRPGDIYLARGKLGWGLLIGVLSFIGMVLLGLIQPGESAISIKFLRQYAPWILIFVLANAFMEELMFRGLFLKQLCLKPWAANLVIALFFTAAHMTVTYTPDMIQFLGILLVLSLLWGWIMQKTESMIASVLFHAGADVVILYGVFSSYGITS